MPSKGRTKALAKILNSMEKQLSDQQNSIKEKVLLREIDSDIKQLEAEISELDKRKRQLVVEKTELSKELRVQQNKNNRKTKILDSLKSRTSDLSSEIQSCKVKPPAFSISEATSLKRKLKPTDSNLPLKAKYTRRKETLDACMHIHGALKKTLHRC